MEGSLTLLGFTTVGFYTPLEGFQTYYLIVIEKSFNKYLSSCFKVKVSNGNIIEVFVYYPAINVALLSFPAA